MHMLWLLLICSLLLAAASLNWVQASGASVSETYQYERGLAATYARLSRCVSDAVSAHGAPTTEATVQLLKVAKEWWGVVLGRLESLAVNPDFFTCVPLESFDKSGGSKLDWNQSVSFDARKLAALQVVLGSCDRLHQDLEDIYGAVRDASSRHILMIPEYAGVLVRLLRESFNLRVFITMAVHKGTWGRLRRRPSFGEDDGAFVLARLLLRPAQALIDSSRKGNLVETHRRARDLVDAVCRAGPPEDWAFLSLAHEFFMRHIGALLWELSTPERLLGPFCNDPQGEKMLGGLKALLAELGHPLSQADPGHEQGQLWDYWRDLVDSLNAAKEATSDFDVAKFQRAADAASAMTTRSFEMLLEGNDELLTGPLGKGVRQVSIVGQALSNPCFGPENIEDLGAGMAAFIAVAVEISLLTFLELSLISVGSSLTLTDQDREKLLHLFNEARHFNKVFSVIQILDASGAAMREQEEPKSHVARLYTEGLMRALSEVAGEYLEIAEKEGFKFGINKDLGLEHILGRHNTPVAVFAREYCLKYVFTVEQERTFYDRIKNIFSYHANRPILRSRLEALISRDLDISVLNLNLGPTSATKSDAGNQASHGQGLKKSGERQGRKKGGRNKRGNKGGKGGGKQQGPTATPKTGATKPSPPSPKQVLLSAAPSSGVQGKVQEEEAIDRPEAQPTWNLVTSSPDRRRELGGLEAQSVDQVLRRHTPLPLVYATPDAEAREDGRADKSKLTIATLNANWANLFGLTTGVLSDKVPWRSPSEAWDHLRDIAKAIKMAAPDIVNLCEVQDGRILQILVELLADLDYRPFLMPSHDSLGQHVGMLVRAGTVVSVGQVGDMAVLGKSLILHVQMENGHGAKVDVVVSGVHLMSSRANSGLTPNGAEIRRLEQAAALKRHLEEQGGDAPHTVYVVLGDFNEESDGAAMRVIRDSMPVLHNVLEGNRDVPASLIDHIYTSHPRLIESSRVMRVDLPDVVPDTFLPRVSDHPMIVATIRLFVY